MKGRARVFTRVGSAVALSALRSSFGCATVQLPRWLHRACGRSTGTAAARRCAPAKRRRRGRSGRVRSVRARGRTVSVITAWSAQSPRGEHDHCSPFGVVATRARLALYVPHDPSLDRYRLLHFSA